MKKTLKFNNTFINKMYSPIEVPYWHLYLNDFRKQINQYMELREYDTAAMCIKELEEISDMFREEFKTGEFWDDPTLNYFLEVDELRNKLIDQKKWYSKVAHEIQ